MATVGIYIIGATASGKSQLAMRVAEEICADIINADSIAFFKSLDIGSAKPSRDAMARVRHHLVSIKPIGSEYTAGEFRRDVENLLVNSATRKFVVAGGSGFYIQAVDRGMYDAHPGDARIRSQLESRADREGIQKLFAELEGLDPESAKKISANDRYRVIRALEIITCDPERRPLSQIRGEFQEQTPNSVFTQSLKVGLQVAPQELQRRIRRRAEKMLEAGLVREVQSILQEVSPDWRPLQSVGYKEVVDMLAGKLRAENLLERICQRTGQLAKKQRTWFQRDKSIHWFDDPEKAFEFILSESSKEN